MFFFALVLFPVAIFVFSTKKVNNVFKKIVILNNFIIEVVVVYKKLQKTPLSLRNLQE
jgi:hypothetical protein